MNKFFILAFTVGYILFSSPASAHFGMVIPTDSMIMPEEARSIDLTLSFSHPFERIGMPMEKPEQFFVIHQGKTSDLTGKLKPATFMDTKAWELNYKIKRPGVYTFAMIPKPYWEPAEDLFIIHYTKTVVTAFGDDSEWDAEAGLPTEIVPLARPFGLWAGNSFQAIVKSAGKPVPYAEVEIEFHNEDGSVKAPNDYMVCQTVKADRNGVFTYVPPVAGWWGFSALNTADHKLEKDGEKKDVELGAVIWVKFHQWPK